MYSAVKAIVAALAVASTGRVEALPQLFTIPPSSTLLQLDLEAPTYPDCAFTLGFNTTSSAPLAILRQNPSASLLIDLKAGDTYYGDFNSSYAYSNAATDNTILVDCDDGTPPSFVCNQLTIYGPYTPIGLGSTEALAGDGTALVCTFLNTLKKNQTVLLHTDGYSQSSAWPPEDELITLEGGESAQRIYAGNLTHVTPFAVIMASPTDGKNDYRFPTSVFATCDQVCA